ncbi:phage tail assembly chaperone family protein, TAC [Acinetobacter junii]|uniref:phage tail assembly chaperone family protein, TAC n=1 Tax=Acinetobacter junii TaxID=40215 RepID=UPI001250480A|nr:phage tail assembly chaperone family protein, TAC [Acinetobacter junii]
MNKLSIADIKGGVLVDAPEKIEVEIMVKGEPCSFETHIKIMDYSTAVAQMKAGLEKKEALASILADCIVDELGEKQFTEDEVRQRFNKPLIDAIWEKIIEKNFLGKVGTQKTSSETVNSGQNLSSMESVEEPLQKQESTLAIESSSTGENIESKEDA